MIIQNRSQGHAVTLDTANNSYNIASFAVTGGDFGANTETVTSVAITNIIWGGGPWTITRNANVVFTTDGQHGDIDLASHGITLNINPTSNVVVNTANASSTLILKVAKYGTSLNPAA